MAEEVWAVTGEEGHVYGLAPTEIAAWELIVNDARSSIFQDGDEVEAERPEDIRLFFMMRWADGHRERDFVVARKWVHNDNPSDIWGAYHVTPVELPESR